MDNTVKYYEIHTVNGLTFRFKLDENPINGRYEPHIWHRHQVEPEEVVAAYMNLSYKSWNFKYCRYEAYSEKAENQASGVDFRLIQNLVYYY